MTQSTIWLPFPPSVNGLYNGGHRTPRRFKSDRYKRWIHEAESALANQRYSRHTGIVNIWYDFTAPDKRVRDLANGLKAVDDLLVAKQIIRDDSDIHILTARWVPGDAGVVIRIQDAGVA